MLRILMFRIFQKKQFDGIQTNVDSLSLMYELNLTYASPLFQDQPQSQ